MRGAVNDLYELESERAGYTKLSVQWVKDRRPRRKRMGKGGGGSRRGHRESEIIHRAPSVRPTSERVEPIAKKNSRNVRCPIERSRGKSEKMPELNDIYIIIIA